MRLGGPTYDPYDSPDSWIAAVRKAGFTATYCPIGPTASVDDIRAYRDAAARNDIVIAEVGAWSNPISTDDAERKKALAHCQANLQLAEQIGARCCVNIAGSRGPKWDGPHESHFTKDVFDIIVQSVRNIIDAVKPNHTYYALETMPWAPPDSPDNYLELIRAIDRKQFAVHLDPVNMINSPRRYYDTGVFIRECFAKLGPYIRTCHGKDILLHANLTTHLDEVRPGAGALDYATFLRELSKLDRDTPLLLEHLPNEQEYRLAAAHVRKVATDCNLELL